MIGDLAEVIYWIGINLGAMSEVFGIDRLIFGVDEICETYGRSDYRPRANCGRDRSGHCLHHRGPLIHADNQLRHYRSFTTVTAVTLRFRRSISAR